MAENFPVAATDFSALPFSAIDRHFAKLMARYEHGSEGVSLAAAIVSYFRGRGHVCLDLEAFCANPFLPDSGEKLEHPPLAKWLKELKRSAAVGSPGEFRPLILDDANRLYLHRYWRYESELAAAVSARAQTVEVNADLLRAGLSRLFPSSENPDWQKVSAFAAVTRRFTIISGGPGTGKTSVVLKILALLLEQEPAARIAISAPTGKAVSRLQESIKSAKEKLACADEIKKRIPEKASTIHRLLGVIPNSPFFKRNEKNKMPVDVLIVDEVSMVDMALMTKLLAATPEKARVILLGDKDQLASVEAGAVLADLCGSAPENGFSKTFRERYKETTGNHLPVAESEGSGVLQDSVVQLQKNYRFGDESFIYRASIAVRSGRFHDLEKVLAQSGSDVQWMPDARFDDQFVSEILRGFGPALQAGDPAEALARLQNFRVLGAVREGVYGISQLNRRIERILGGNGLIKQTGDWYEGRPIMVTRNDYQARLFNGDTGVIASDTLGRTQAHFVTADDEIRSLFPGRLPQHETVFAMTIHKSQGSEFDHVLMVLPEADCPILTRELIYTGLTRARRKVILMAKEHILRKALSRQVSRSSGLQDRLVG